MQRAILVCLVVLAVSACGQRIQSGSVFENLIYDSQQAKRPADDRDIRTEYPLPDNWGPRIAEYRGNPNLTTGSVRRGNQQNGQREFSVNFNRAELAEVVRGILLDTLKIGYTLDSNVKGTVTVSSPERISRQELLQLLETVLQMNRAVMIKTATGYRIVPDTTVRAGTASTVSYANEQAVLGAGYGISVLPLRHIAGSKIIKMLGSFVAPPGVLRAQATGNLLFIRGTSAERSNLVSFARTLDVDWLSGQSAGVYRLLHAKPETVVSELSRIFKVGQNQADDAQVRFVPIERMNGVLVLTSQQALLDRAAAWIKRLDKSSPIADGVFVYRVEHGSATRLADILNKMFGGGSLSVDEPSNEVAPGAAPAIVRSVPRTPGASTGQGNQRTTAQQARPASGAAPSPLANSPSQSTGARGNVRVVADESQNKLLISASLAQYRKIVNVLARLDQPATQVLIKATLAEVQLNKNLRYGVQAFLQETNRAPNGVLGFSNGASLTIQPALPGLNFLVGLPSTPKVILDALSNQTSVRLVSSPSLVVVNGGQAVLQVGDDVPVATRQAVSVTDPAAPIVNDIEFRKTGVILRVKPLINSDGLVTMEVEQEVSSVANTTAGALTPTISQRRIVSTIAVYSGQMVVLGGLVSERTNKFANRVPIVEHVPVVGDVVGKTDDKGARSELVVFIQPKVIRDASDATQIADELRARLGELAPDDRRRKRVLRFQNRRRLVEPPPPDYIPTK